MLSESGIAAGDPADRSGHRCAGHRPCSQANLRDLHAIADLVKAPIDQVPTESTRVWASVFVLRTKKSQALKGRLAGQSASGDLSTSATMVGDIHVISQAIDGADMTTLRSAIDQSERSIVCCGDCARDR